MKYLFISSILLSNIVVPICGMGGNKGQKIISSGFPVNNYATSFEQKKPSTNNLIMRLFDYVREKSTDNFITRLFYYLTRESDGGRYIHHYTQEDWYEDMAFMGVGFVSDPRAAERLARISRANIARANSTQDDSGAAPDATEQNSESSYCDPTEEIYNAMALGDVGLGSDPRASLRLARFQAASEAESDELHSTQKSGGKSE